MSTLAQLVQQNQRFLLISHVEPDGDAVGAVLGLWHGLQQMGKVSTAVLKDGCPDTFNFLSSSEQIVDKLPDLNKVDLCIVLDANDAARTGYFSHMVKLSKAGKLCFIDHHPRGDLSKLCSVFLHDEKASSCCELVYQLLQELEIKITPALATILLNGLYTDTGGFQHPTTSSKSLQLAAELLSRGGRLNQIIKQVSRSKSIANLKLLGLAMERLRVSKNYACAHTVLTLADQTSNHTTLNDTQGIIAELNVLPQAAWALLLVETSSHTLRGSLRSGVGRKINVNILAKILGGGRPSARFRLYLERAT